MEVFIARQPIFNIDEEIVAYELLYRNNFVNSFPQTDSDGATIDVLINAFLSIGITEVTNGKPAFINFTENLILEGNLDFLNTSQVVIELLEDIPITPELIERLKLLKNNGFTLALDDFIMNDEILIYDELFTTIDYIKIDFLFTPELKRIEIEEKIKTNFPIIKLLAEKIETREQYEIAKKSGYSLFQGYFFEKPQILTATEIPANLFQYFQIISLLRDDETDIDLLANNIEMEISLTYRLLKLINDSSRRSKTKVRSIKQAILVLGLRELQKWIYLLAMREADVKKNNDVFKELMYASLFRAKACEKCAHLNYKGNFSEYFLVGLFSLIDSLLQRPMNKIVTQLPLSESILETISGGHTQFTPYLQFSIALGKLDWENIIPLATELKIPTEAILPIYEEVKQWVDEALIMK